MQVLLYIFNKRENSTKCPLPSEAEQTLDMQLKEETSFLTPTLLISPEGLSPAGQFSPTMYNYVMIPYWQRYYYVRDWRYVGGIWECDLTVDVLASFKYNIGETEAYILRSASFYDGNLSDAYYPAKTEKQITNVPVADAWYNVAPSGGTYVLGVINYQSTGRVGAVAYYAMNNEEFASTLQYLFSNDIYFDSSIEEISEGLFMAMFNPFQYIVSCMWFPIPPSAFGSVSTYVKVGYWDSRVRAIMVENLAEKTYVTATIPNHPQIDRGQYLNYAPYTRLTLYIPPFGEIPIDTSYLNKGNYLYSAVTIDHITGQATIRLSICSGPTNLNEFNIMTERTAQIGVSIQIAQYMYDNIGILESFGDVISNGVIGNIGSMVGSFVRGLEAAQMPQITTSGANGSFIEYMLQPALIAEHLILADENNTEFGRPLMATRKINTMSGYIQCGEDDHPFPCTQGEKTEINQYLKNGFFYE